MSDCSCYSTGARRRRHGAGDHLDPACPHSTLYFQLVLMPMLGKLRHGWGIVDKKRRRVFIADGAQGRTMFWFPRDNRIKVVIDPRPNGGVRGRRSVAA